MAAGWWLAAGLIVFAMCLTVADSLDEGRSSFRRPCILYACVLAGLCCAIAVGRRQWWVMLIGLVIMLGSAWGMSLLSLFVGRIHKEYGYKRDGAHRDAD